VASHAVDLSPGDSASPAPSKDQYGQGQSHPVDISPGGTSQGSFASSPASSIQDESVRFYPPPPVPSVVHCSPLPNAQTTIEWN